MISNQPVGILQRHVVCQLLSVSWDGVLTPGNIQEAPGDLPSSSCCSLGRNHQTGAWDMQLVRVWRVGNFLTKFSFPECSASQPEGQARWSHSEAIREWESTSSLLCVRPCTCPHSMLCHSYSKGSVGTITAFWLGFFILLKILKEFVSWFSFYFINKESKTDQSQSSFLISSFPFSFPLPDRLLGRINNLRSNTWSDQMIGFPLNQFSHSQWFCSLPFFFFPFLYLTAHTIHVAKIDILNSLFFCVCFRIADPGR